MGEENRLATLETDNAPGQTVWLHDDDTMRQVGDHPPEAHWSEQVTQPLVSPWPAPTRRRVDPRAAVPAGREIRAMSWGMGYGVVLTLIALGMIALLVIANGWLTGGSPTPSGPEQRPVPAQTAPHTPLPSAPAATSVPTLAAQPTTTPQPAATPQPSATAEPSATPQPSATAEPSATPQPSATTGPGITTEPGTTAGPSTTGSGATTEPGAAPSPTSLPTATPSPTPLSTATPSPTPLPTATTQPTAIPRSTAEP